MSFRLSLLFCRANDCYHTCYTLSGLSAAQNKMTWSASLAESVQSMWKAPGEYLKGSNESDAEAEFRSARTWATLVAWKAGEPLVVGEPQNRVVSHFFRNGIDLH